MSAPALSPAARAIRSLAAKVDEACGRIPPLWPLQNFVAVNPFVGLSGMGFLEVARLIEKVAHGSIFMDSEYYREQLGNGSIEASDIRAALASLERPADPIEPVSWLARQLEWKNGAVEILTVADWLDRIHRTAWAAFIVDEISKWCSSYFDRGQSVWEMPWKKSGLYEAWKCAAELDANVEVCGLPGFRSFVRELPGSADAAIEASMQLLNVPAGLAVDFLHRQLMSVSGWSAYAAYVDRGSGEAQTVKDVLAIRLAYDAALTKIAKEWTCHTYCADEAGQLNEAKQIAQLAAEYAFRRTLVDKIQGQWPWRAAGGRKAVQAVFCIDVRSEPYRRALEAQSEEIETIGFAGFFGMPVEFQSGARCPVLISPQHKLGAEQRDTVADQMSRHFGEVWKGMRESATGCFSAVEVGGIWSAVSTLRRTFQSSPSVTPAAKLHWSISLPERVNLAQGALRSMSLEASRLAPIVLLCGHGSRTENNPYASSLDCGACGGHQGDVNARFAAALLNDSDVRAGLAERGISIPDDTVFIAGLHVTSTDEVVLYDAERLSPEQRRTLENWLQSASRLARMERGATLGEMQKRSADWSEVRPEWGLAGNAAFIAAPRSLTRGLDLQGRVFLHDYDATLDVDGSVLELILTAPVVVASWINLQYYASTVNNALFGSGNKTIHNVTGRFGVWEGNGGDLRTGLPLQSLHDGSRSMHEPLRLQVFVAASRSSIDEVLRKHAPVRDLVVNGWIHLLSIEGGAIYECHNAGNWRVNQREE